MGRRNGCSSATRHPSSGSLPGNKHAIGIPCSPGPFPGLPGPAACGLTHAPRPSAATGSHSAPREL
ncbi:hypothetical protein ISF6_2764 [Piscinibacter sakaiensis]|uniref:Uncharacterized protein n=1 Tax=Piscinibacter sakaiensis TaxID=1547922 RepID=A0A0K8P319_PISS1|nr:hypothetical protein ISF6_2764 [Piscinibacter sakaiensis]